MYEMSLSFYILAVNSLTLFEKKGLFEKPEKPLCIMDMVAEIYL